MDTRVVALALALGVPLDSLAQRNEPAQEPQDQPEEMLIIGKRQMLRIQMMEAEIVVYDIFNKFNDEKRFNISCNMQRPTGTRLETQVCEPEFVSKAARAHAQDYFESYRAYLDPHTLDGSNSVQSPPFAAVVASQQPQYRRKMWQVANEHPEFLDAIIRYSKLREQYEKEK